MEVNRMNIKAVYDMFCCDPYRVGILAHSYDFKYQAHGQHKKITVFKSLYLG